MKQALTYVAIVVGSLLSAYSITAVAAETKEVCIDKTTKDGKPVMGKDGKQEKVCKKMKVHEKLEGTKVPEKKAETKPAAPAKDAKPATPAKDAKPAEKK